MKAAKTKPSGVLKYSSLIALQRGTVQGVTPTPPGKQQKLRSFRTLLSSEKKKKETKKNPEPASERRTGNRGVKYERRLEKPGKSQWLVTLGSLIN